MIKLICVLVFLFVSVCTTCLADARCCDGTYVDAARLCLNHGGECSPYGTLEISATDALFAVSWVTTAFEIAWFVPMCTHMRSHDTQLGIAVNFVGMALAITSEALAIGAYAMSDGAISHTYHFATLTTINSIVALTGMIGIMVQTGDYTFGVGASGNSLMVSGEF